MTIRASRATWLLVAVATAWLGLALCVPAAHATYSRVQIVKINQGGDPGDVFWFDTRLTGKSGKEIPAFPLRGGVASDPFEVRCNAGTCLSSWGAPKQIVTERPAAGYTVTAVACVHTTATSSGYGLEPSDNSPAETDTTFDPATRTISFKLDVHEWVKCYVTNTRDTGTIKVTKKVVAPAGDSGKFNLRVDGQAKAADVGDGGTTGVQTVTTGSRAVSETAGTGTSLADYAASTSCSDTAHPATAADTDGNVAVGKGDQWECVITNTRKTNPPTNPPPSETTAQSLAPQFAVSPARVRPGAAKLNGPRGCPRTNAVAASVTGRRIVKVTFYVDGRKVKTLTKANAKGRRWTLAMNVGRLEYGAHRVQAKVQFAASSQTKARTLRLSFDRCRPAVVKPKFTG